MSWAFGCKHDAPDTLCETFAVTENTGPEARADISNMLVLVLKRMHDKGTCKAYACVL